MGLFGSIGKALFGGQGASGYASKRSKEYESGAADYIGSRLGAKRNVDKKGNVSYDYTGTGAPIDVGTATSGYDFGGYEQTLGDLEGKVKGFDTSGISYTPKNYQASQFNFETLPEEYYNQQYELGAGDVRRESEGELERTRRAVGARSGGLLLKAAENTSRRTAENLARMKADLSGRAAQEKTQAAIQQQLSQAQENFKAAGFNDDQARTLANLEMQKKGMEQENIGRLSGIAAQKLEGIKGKAGVTEAERSYRDRALEYLMQLYQSGLQSTQAAATAKNQRSSGLAGIAAESAGTAAGAAI